MAKLPGAGSPRETKADGDGHMRGFINVLS
jgi:hypothetical protein